MSCSSRDLSVNWDEGGMPWTCLPGEPSDINWCNDPGGWDLYKNPPQAWIGADDHGDCSGDCKHLAISVNLYTVHCELFLESAGLTRCQSQRQVHM